MKLEKIYIKLSHTLYMNVRIFDHNHLMSGSTYISSMQHLMTLEVFHRIL